MDVYIDFDNTIAESNQKIIDILNKMYNLEKTEEDLKDFGFKSIAPITNDEKMSLFESDEFFENLKLKDGVLNVIDKHRNNFNFIVTTIGSEKNLSKKREWLKKQIPFELDFVGIVNDRLSKKMICMKKGVQVDDCMFSLDTNAKVKILYKSNNNFPWQKGYINKDVIVVNNWSEIDEILDFLKDYDYKTLKKRTKRG